MGNVARFVLKLLGWRAEGQPPSEPKYVMIAAPHTSNWDVMYMVLFALHYGIHSHFKFLMKESMFRFPLRGLSRWMGGVPVDRSKPNGVVGQSVEFIQQSERIILGMSPEGTRSSVMRWKTGFYHIAVGAGVPIALSFLDYGRKVAGFGPTFYPTGDIDADMAQIHAFYAKVTGKYPDKFSNAQVAEREQQ